MKIITLLLCLFASYSSFGQYHKMIDTTKMWDMRYVDKDLMDIRPPYEEYFRAYFSGDTIYNNVTYKIMKRQVYLTKYMSGATQIIDHAIRPEEVYCVLREDTVAKKVFILYGQQDFLLLDFSLNVGDTLRSYYYLLNGPGTPVVDSISTITLKNGESRKKYCFSPNHSCENYYIEGIGGGNGIIDPFDIIGLSGHQENTFINCLLKDSVSLVGNCGLNVGISDTYDNATNTTIYPNPFQDNLYIKGLTQNFDYSIFNIYGQKVKEGHSSNNSIPNLRFLPSGQYFIQIKTAKQTTSYRAIKK